MVNARRIQHAVLLLSLAVAGCRYESGTLSRTHIPAETLSRAINAVVRIENSEGHGTGYVIHKDKDSNEYLIVTCSHVIVPDRAGDPDLADLRFRYNSLSGKSSVAEFTWAVHDRTSDLALLCTESIPIELPTLEICLTPPDYSIPPPLLIVGFPHDEHTLLQCKTMNRSWPDLLNQTHWVLDGVLETGSSGSPLISMDGIVLGTINKRHPKIHQGLCVSQPTMESFFLKTSRLEYQIHTR